MSKSNLAYIDKHVEMMLQKEMVSPTAHKVDVTRANKPRVIAGFEVPDPDQTARKIEEARARRREIVGRYRMAKDELLDIVHDVRAKPLAVLPKAMFDIMCRESNMYYVPKNLRTEVNPTHFLTWLSTPIGEQMDPRLWGQSARSVQTLRKGRGNAKTPEAYVEQFGRESVLEHLLKLDGTRFESEDEEVQRLVKQARLDGENQAFLSAMRGDVTITGRPQAAPTDGRKYDIVLPIPPEDVCETLLKIADLGPQTVCVYGAVDFAPGGLMNVLHVAKRDREERDQRISERVDWQLHDPIVYLTRGPVVAVMAQFGPFPVEQALVNRIQAAEFLPQA